MKMIRLVAGAIIASLTFTAETVAQSNELSAAVSIELNAVKSKAESCTLSFLVLNGHAVQIEKAVYETVLFDKDGQVDRLTLFDFGTLPAQRPRVRQFTVSGISCEGLSKVLINGAHTCEAAQLTDTACEDGLVLRTRTKIEVIG
ncbi:hypothetical protein [Roseovarius sp. EL26]|uniref:hypothetical protein n=1 Tax=Roseovarius sp. EL26 TaxID=2126672 RepID=UPI0020B162F4|nr:hypothetical protein [Roseovarius sp. EL26]